MNDLIMQQILDQIKEVFSNTLSTYLNNTKELFEGLLKHKLFLEIKNFE